MTCDLAFKSDQVNFHLELNLKIKWLEIFNKELSRNATYDENSKIALS